MLFNNHICKVQSQYFKQLQEQHMLTNLRGDNISVLMPLSAMLSANSNMAYDFACESYKLFVSKGFCRTDVFNTNYYQLAVYGVALSNFFIGYNTETGESNLYTSSYYLLTQLATRGILMGKRTAIATEMATLEDALVSGNKIPKSLQEGDRIQAVRLDYEYSNGKLIFKPTIPRSQLDLSRYCIIPLQAVEQAMHMLNDQIQDKVLEVTMGDKVRYITKSAPILSMIYGEQRARYLVSANYDARVFRFTAPNVGASIYSVGVTNIDLAKIDRIRVVDSVMDIDLSEVKLDTSRAVEYIKSTIPSMNETAIREVAEYLKINIRNISGIDYVQVFKNGLALIPTYKAYDAIKAFPQYFDLNKFKSLTPKYSSGEQIQIPETIEELEALLKTGIFKVMMRTKKGSTVSVICTNSPKELASIYGSDYYARFESEGNRLRRLDYIVKTKYPEGISTDVLMKLMRTLNVVTVAQSLYSIVDDHETDFVTYDIVHQAIARELYHVKERTTVIKQTDLVTVRSCECDAEHPNPSAYYKNLSPRAITSIMRVTRN